MPMPEPQMLRTTWTDSVTGRQGFLVIDRLVRGVAAGGTRIRRGLTLEETARLARAMSYKNGALAIAAGGAKCGIDCDPHDPAAIPMLTRFVRAMHPIFDAYMGTGEDLGVSQETIAEVFAAAGLETSMRAVLRKNADPRDGLARVGRALAMSEGGVPMVDLVGGFGVAEAAEAALAHLGREVAGTRVAVQGFGSMGGSAARFLARKGARVVAIADVRGLVSNPDGLDVEALLATRDRFGEIDREALRPADRMGERDDWPAADCDLLVPAALGDSIDATNCGRVRATVIVEAANLPTTPEAEERLRARGVTLVPDFVANSGTNGWLWWLILGEVEAEPAAGLAKIAAAMREAVERLLALSEAEGISPRRAAERTSMATLDELAAKHGEEGPLLLQPF